MPTFSCAQAFVAREDPTLVGGASVSNYYSLGTYRREALVPYSLDTLA